MTVRYATADGTAKAGLDYEARSGTLSFAQGERTKTVDVNVTADAIDESDETLALTLSDPVGATLATSTAAGTIVDDDAAPPVIAVSITSLICLAEPRVGSTTRFEFVVTLSAPAPAGGLSVGYATRAGSATAEVDYTAASGSLAFAPGERTKKIVVLVLGDANNEQDEDFFVDLAGVTAPATLGDKRSGRGVISSGCGPCD